MDEFEKTMWSNMYSPNCIVSCRLLDMTFRFRGPRVVILIYCEENVRGVLKVLLSVLTDYSFFLELHP